MEIVQEMYKVSVGGLNMASMSPTTHTHTHTPIIKLTPLQVQMLCT